MILSIWVGIYFNVKVYRECKARGIDWNPLEGSIWTWFGFLIGTACGGLSLVYLIVKYLP